MRSRTASGAPPALEVLALRPACADDWGGWGHAHGGRAWFRKHVRWPLLSCSWSRRLPRSRTTAIRPIRSMRSIELAGEVRKPLFLHERDAHSDFVAALKPARAALVGGVAHCFTGGPPELDAYLDLDLYIGVTGWVCDERRGSSLRAAVPRIPLERLLLETDSPYLLPRDLAPPPRDRRNEPAFLAHVLERVAALMDLPMETVAAATTANAERLFVLPPRPSVA